MLQHPELPFVIEADLQTGRYVKRYPNGTVESATTTDYLLALVLIKLYNQPVLEEGITVEAKPYVTEAQLKDVAEDLSKEIKKLTTAVNALKKG